MRPLELLSTIAKRATTGVKRALYIVSAPGSGKTQIAEQGAAAAGPDFGFKYIHAPLLQPEDYGFPVISADKKTVDFVVSAEKFPIVGSDCPDKGIFLIDELPQADASSQKILANLIQAREIHGKKLKPGWYIVATGNRTVDRSGANTLLGHLKNRVTQVELDVSIDDWVLWALDNNVRPEVIAFLRFCPALLNNYDGKNEVNATPRAWVDGVSATLEDTPTAIDFECFKGDVGEGPAAQFTGYLRVWREVPSIDLIIANPTGAPVPSKENPAALWAVSVGLAHKASEKNFDRLMEYIERLPAEFQAVFIKDAEKLSKGAITHSKAFIKWATTKGAKLYSAKTS